MTAYKEMLTGYKCSDHILMRWAQRVQGERLSDKAMKAYILENRDSLASDVCEAFLDSTYLFQRPFRNYGKDTTRGYYLNGKLLIITDEVVKKLVTVYQVSTGVPEPEASEITDLIVSQIIRIRNELEQCKQYRKDNKHLRDELVELEKQQEATNRRITELHTLIARGSNSKISKLEHKLYTVGGVLIDGKLLKVDGGILR